MAIDSDRVVSVRRTLLQYGGSHYLRSNFFKDIPEKTWAAQVAPKLKAFVANPDFMGYVPAGNLPRGFEDSLATLSNLIIKLEEYEN